MTPRVVRAEYIQGYLIRVWFGDGSSAEIDFAKELEGEVFDPLRDISYFRQFLVHPELHTLVWPNGADFAPEFLYSKVQVAV